MEKKLINKFYLNLNIILKNKKRYYIMFAEQIPMATPINNDVPITNAFTIPICPITHEHIINPVIDHEGNTYESHAIREWIRSNHSSPITRAPLEESNLIPNRALIHAIEALTISISLQNEEKPSFRSREKNIANCSGCGKLIAVSQNYQGKKQATCYNCRPWNCKSCTFTNVAALKKCSMCETIRV